MGEGVFTAVEAMPAVLARYPRARLRIVGTGGQSAAVADLVARSGLTTRVQLLGHVDEPTLRAVYTSSDLVIAPSSTNPSASWPWRLPRWGVPLVVGDTGGLAEFVTDQRGRRCRPNDAADLAAQIVTTFDEPEQTARRRANASLALSQYTWDEAARRTAEVYDKARRRQRPARVTRERRQTRSGSEEGRLGARMIQIVVGHGQRRPAQSLGMRPASRRAVGLSPGRTCVGAHVDR